MMTDHPQCESPTKMLRRISQDLADLAEQDLGDGHPAEPLTATRLSQAHETLIALYHALHPDNTIHGFDRRNYALMASGECAVAATKIKMGIGITEPFPWERIQT